MKPIAFVCHQPSAGPGVMEEVLTVDRVQYITVQAWDERQEWPRATDLSALVFLGGDMNVDEVEEFPFLLRSRALLEESISSGLPTLGICLGAQMIARVLGAKVIPGAARQIGFQRVHPTKDKDDLLAAIDKLDGVFQWHEDALTVPSDTVLLHSDLAAPQSFRFRDRVYALQFHFEITDAILRGWLAEAEDLEAQWHTSEEDLINQANDLLPPQREAAAVITRAFASLASSLAPSL